MILVKPRLANFKMTTQVETVRTSPELPRYIQVPETKYECMPSFGL